MAPAADLDERLLALQAKVAQRRVVHEDLVQRRDLCQRMHYEASARALDDKVGRAFHDLQRASRELAAYISQRQRR